MEPTKETHCLIGIDFYPNDGYQKCVQLILWISDGDNRWFVTKPEFRVKAEYLGKPFSAEDGWTATSDGKPQHYDISLMNEVYEVYPSRIQILIPNADKDDFLAFTQARGWRSKELLREADYVKPEA